MTKIDKYHLFDRECPFKEVWLNESDKIRHDEVRKKLLKISKEYCDEKYRKKKIS